MAPTLSQVQTVTQRAYNWVKKSVRPAPGVSGSPQWSAATSWSGPLSLSGLPGSGSLQAQNAYVLGSTLYQGYWRNNEGWSRQVPIAGDVPQWGSAAAWSGPAPISDYPGSGDMQAMASFVVGVTLYQEYWRGNQGYRRSVPIVGTPQWGAASVWTVLSPGSLPGSGSPQALNYYVIDGVIFESVWRGDQGWTRTIPIANGAPQWGSAGQWSGPSSLAALPGSGSIQTLNNYIIGNTMYQNFWRGDQGWSRVVPIGSAQHAVSMYRALPLTAKVPPGYTIPNSSDPCHYVRHLGNEYHIGSVTYGSITLYDLGRSANQATCYAEVGNWPDGQPSLWVSVVRNYNSTTGQTTVDIYYYGKPSGDTRDYPVKLYWGPTEILADHRVGEQWIYHGLWDAACGQQGNKYFLRTEDQVALKLLQAEPDNAKLNDWCSAQWIDTHADIYAPFFNMGHNKPNDYMYQAGSPMYRDCTMMHQGCPNDWPADMSRLPATGWGFSHRSKVCVWPHAYTWVLAQDPLGLLAQAMHTLIKTNNPWTAMTNAWPSGAVVPAPASFTPVGIANWVLDHFWRPGVGVHMFQVPVIGQDDRASSLRTNQFLMLTTLLAYRFLVGGWASIADEVAQILVDVSIGGPGQPAYGCRTQNEGNIVRSDYFGAQLYIWDAVGNPTLGLVDFGWLRQTINHFLNLPPDDTDYILSTVETTASYCQALRVYGYHKYGWLFGPLSTIPCA